MKEVVCVATGPSLTIEDLNRLKSSDKAVYLVKDAYTLAPWASLVYGADSDWWDVHKGVPDFNGRKICCDPKTCDRWDLELVKVTSSKIFADEEPIASGGNSGFQLVNIAYLHGFTRIFLLGYDMGFDDKKHFFGEHPAKIDRPSDYKKFIDHFKKAKPIMDDLGLEVINLTLKSNLTMFRKAELCEFT